MSFEIVIVICLLAVIIMALGIIGNNIDHYHATSIPSKEFMRLFEELGRPPVFRKRLFFRTYLAIPYQGFIIASSLKNFSEADVAKLKPFSCGRYN